MIIKVIITEERSRAMAGFYTDEMISEVIAANDIVDIASKYVRLKRNGNSYMGCCPFHREKTPSFHISADKQLYHCFGCGAGGSVLQFVMNAEGLDFQDAVRYLADNAGIRLPEGDSNNSDEIYRKKQKLYELNREAAIFFRKCLLSDKGKIAREYLTKRGLSGKTIASFGLGFSPPEWDSLLRHMTGKGYDRRLLAESGLCIQNDKGHMYDRFRERVMFPIIDVRGNIIGFGGRILSGDGAKYMNSPESIVYDKGKNLFALNIAKKSKRGYYILVEGYMDVISLHQAGIDSAVAGCGTALTPNQAKLLSKSPVYLCYDSDEAGIKACERAAGIFKGFNTHIKVIPIPSCKDADEFIKKHGGTAFEKLIENAKPVTEYRLDLLLRGADLTSTEQKIEIVHNASQIFSEISDAVEREAYINMLSVKTGISRESINSEVRKINGRAVRKEVNSELRKVSMKSGSEILNSGSGRKISAERGYLATLAEDKRVFLEFGTRLDERDFSSELHKKIYSAISEFYNEGLSGKCTDYLVAKFSGYEQEISAVLLSSENIEDFIRAADDYASVIENEAFNEKLSIAQANGDIQKINALLKEKKTKRH